ncbi:N-acetyltransferase family protein [Siculibacillus lacustris]|uniref:N-acetyltransferase family protein n=1 Tax=Siculibacillus lacustris TaxID=1549641 RepID=A0A4Q9VN00_9HYPH|nr:GNAT family N-acetyltransferase [Siculibacillus lacustris]TBW36455.1 N-acetyltransferase family protein [Siculibacillus lacustris]
MSAARNGGAFIRIRDAVDGDLEAIRTIYNRAVTETTAIWNDTVVDLDDRRRWMAARTALGYPVLVAEIDGVIAGYGSFADFRAFEGYRATAEHSVYVADTHRRRGVARAILIALEARARALGKHVLVAAIEAENTASIALHRDLGFVETGRLPQVGRKFGRWLDLAFLVKILEDPAAP